MGAPLRAGVSRLRVHRRGNARMFLSEHLGDAKPDTLVYIRVSDVSLIATEFRAEIEDMPWAHEVHLTDPDGNRLRIGTPKP